MTTYVLLGWLLLSASASAECTREFLIGSTNKYVAAQAAGSANDVVALAAPNVTYTENQVPRAILEGVLAEPINIDHNRSIHDTVNCATFTEIIAATNPHQYVIGTRILFDGDGKISLMESIVTDAGDWAFNATGWVDLYWNSLENWDPIPEEERDSRDVIQSAGNSYFERFKNESVVVPFGVPCSRLEGGASTAPLNMTGDSCTLAGLPSTLVVTDRRFVVDETLGVVDIFLGFPGLDRSQGQEPMPDSHLFRIESGKIRYIHTVSSCVEAGCGMNGTIPPSKVRRLRHF
ncbi:hypothetical protein F4805DRAFT_472895 [Annulohypoxylon moriforme]|nr:hypothetical protein F4805DRAFT_472895 [Annulohypoxylon moriforme]